MKKDETIRLGDLDYRIVTWLGAGYVAQVYQAERLTDDLPVAIKLLKEEHLTSHRIRGEFQDEGRVLRLIEASEKTHGTHYAIRMYADGQDAAGRLFQIQELAKGRPVIHWLPLDDQDPLRGEELGLDISIQLAHLLEISHAAGIALPDMKMDALFWDGTSLQVIDWNLASHDEREKRLDLFRCGALLHRIFTERTVQIDREKWQVQGELGFGIPRWHELTRGTRMIITRALHRDEARRFDTARALRGALSWHKESLSLARRGDLSALLERAGKASFQDRWEEIAAVCQLALPLTTDEETRRRVQRLSAQAQQELQNEILRPLGGGQSYLGAGLYPEAIEEFESVLGLDPANRPAHYYLAQAHTLRALAKRRGSAPGDSAQLKQITDQIVENLIRRDYGTAEQWFAQARDLAPPLPELERFAGAIQAGYLELEAEQLLGQGDYESALARLRSAQVQARDQSWIPSLVRQVELERDRAAKIAEVRAEAALAFDGGRYDAAIRYYEQVLELDPTNTEARRRREVALERKQVDELLTRGIRACRDGQLADAEELLVEAAQLDPNHPESGPWLVRVRSLLQDEEQRRRWVTEAALLLAQERYLEARDKLQQVFTQMGVLATGSVVASGNGSQLRRLSAPGEPNQGPVDEKALPVHLPVSAPERATMQSLYNQVLTALRTAVRAHEDDGLHRLSNADFGRAEQAFRVGIHLVGERDALARLSLERLLDVQQGIEHKARAQTIEEEAGKLPVQEGLDRVHAALQLMPEYLSVDLKEKRAHFQRYHIRLRAARALLDEATTKHAGDAGDFSTGVQVPESAMDFASVEDSLKQLEDELAQQPVADPRWPGMAAGQELLQIWQQQLLNEARSGRQIEDRFQEGLEAWSAGDLSRARGALEAICKARPKHAKAGHWLDRVYQELDIKSQWQRERHSAEKHLNMYRLDAQKEGDLLEAGRHMRETLRLTEIDRDESGPVLGVGHE